MGATFFYMDFMIIYKWNLNYYEHSHEAPSIITMLINMPLHSGNPGEFALFKN